MQFPKLKNLFVSETCFRFCAIDLQISILALAIASNKRSKTISETCTKWSQFGAVSETPGLAFGNVHFQTKVRHLILSHA